MSEVVPSYETPEKFDNNREVIELTAKQVIKDFGDFGMEISFSWLPEKTPYQELFDQVEPFIRKMEKSRMASLFYRIDLNQKELGKALLARPDISYSQVVTDQILRREMKKVLTRLYFK